MSMQALQSPCPVLLRGEQFTYKVILIEGDMSDRMSSDEFT